MWFVLSSAAANEQLVATKRFNQLKCTSPQNNFIKSSGEAELGKCFSSLPTLSSRGCQRFLKVCTHLKQQRSPGPMRMPMTGDLGVFTSRAAALISRKLQNYALCRSLALKYYKEMPSLRMKPSISSRVWRLMYFTSRNPVTIST